jgi:hypothetical protein
MVGDDRVRFCTRCARHVYDISTMPRTEAELMLVENEPTDPDQAPCIRIYRRADGTVLTGDCPIGTRRRHGQLLVVATVVSGLAAVVSFGGPIPASERSRHAARVTHWAELTADPLAAFHGPPTMGRLGLR